MMCGGHAPGEVIQAKQSIYVSVLCWPTFAIRVTSRLDDRRAQNMYGHGFSMLFLWQAYGMTQKAEIGEKIRKRWSSRSRSRNKTKVVASDQKSNAGVSVTVCQIMGFVRLADAGVNIPMRLDSVVIVQKSQNRTVVFDIRSKGAIQHLR